ncbi:hypothetical protein NUSPORA_02385 [Nucleospora cyclopteri]
MFYKISSLDVKYETVESVKEIIKELKDIKLEITELDLSNNTFVPEVFKEICKIIEEMKRLKVVNFESIISMLNYDEMVQICDLMSYSLTDKIVSLNLSANALSCRFPESLGDFISKCSLIDLNLYNCGLGKEGIERLGEFLDKVEKKELVTLNVGKNRINSIDSHFGEVLNKFKNIKDFKMAHNTIYEGMDEFLEKIDDLDLEVFDISDNFIENSSVFCKLIKGFSHLHELYIRDIKTEEMNDILQAILEITVESPELGGMIERPNMILDVSQNDMENEELLNKIERICKKYSIKKLYIYDNFFENIEKVKELVYEQDGEVIEMDPKMVEDVEDEMLKEKVEKL